MNEARLRKSREAVYGPPTIGFGALGKAWAAVLSDYYQQDVAPLPPHVVALMLVSLKVQRAAKPFKAKQDSIDDGVNYLRIVAELDPRLQKKGRRNASRS